MVTRGHNPIGGQGCHAWWVGLRDMGPQRGGSRFHAPQDSVVLSRRTKPQLARTYALKSSAFPGKPTSDAGRFFPGHAITTIIEVVRHCPVVFQEFYKLGGVPDATAIWILKCNRGGVLDAKPYDKTGGPHRSIPLQKFRLIFFGESLPGQTMDVLQSPDGAAWPTSMAPARQTPGSARDADPNCTYNFRRNPPLYNFTNN